MENMKLECWRKVIRRAKKVENLLFFKNCIFLTTLEFFVAVPSTGSFLATCRFFFYMLMTTYIHGLYF